jgi:membrane protease YdiL (CAAX protease family)
MIGILVELFLSALLLWLLYKQSLLVLGIAPTKERLTWLVVGFLTAAAVCVSYHMLVGLFSNAHWSGNKGASPQSIASSSWWTLRSVLFEELLFRGALLYIAIQRLGTKTACIVSATAFGVYHWFSYGALGNPVQMILIFLMTGIWGFMFAVAFARTRSLYLPIALHFGWNWVHTVVFSQGPLGHQLLIATNPKALEGLPSLVMFLWQVFALPLLVLLYLRWRLRRKNHTQPAAGW